MKKKIISKIELSYIIFLFLVSALQIIFFPLIKDKLETMVFNEAPVHRIDYYCEKEKVIKSSKTSFISLLCRKINAN